MASDRLPEPVLVLSESERIRAYVHPTRMSILSILGPADRTVTAVARELGVHPANLTRHFRLLERTGLIRLVEKRDTGRNLEKYYRAVALGFDVRMQSDRIEDRRATALAILRDNLSSAIVTARRPSSNDVVGLLAIARINREGIAALQRRLSDVLAEFRALDVGDGQAYSLVLALYPNETPTSQDEAAEVTIDDAPPGGVPV